METKVAENKTAKNNSDVKNPNPVTVENKNPQFVAGNPVNKDSAKPEVKQEAEKGKEAPKTEAPKAEQAKAPEPPKAGEAKGEVKAVPAKSVRNLAETIKVLEELHRLTVQRNKLLSTIDNLESFEVELKQDFDETEGNYYQGCVLTIEDDNRRKFSTKNPVIIWTVAQQINSLCVDKLSEVEARIVITA
jgi:hypothetical protein